jgi:glycerol-3-phosphate acyltransferase PlsY
MDSNDSILPTANNRVSAPSRYLDTTHYSPLTTHHSPSFTRGILVNYAVHGAEATRPRAGKPMNYLIITLLIGMGAYLIGAIPFGLLIARSRGIDIRSVGSRNIGATNVFRCVGKPWGIATFILDMGKGWCGAVAIPALVAWLPGVPSPEAIEWRLLGGVCAVIGHTWPVYAGFKGGKGVATSVGMLIGLAPAAAGLALAVWFVIFLAGRIVSLASILAAAVLGVAIWFPPFRPAEGPLLPAVMSLLALLVIVRHHSNIRRLLNGTEPRLELRRKPPSSGEGSAS